MVRLSLHLCLAAGLMLLAPAGRSTEPLLFGSIESATAAGPVRGWWAKVHLDHPGVKVGVTAPVVASPDQPPGTEASLLPVNEWAEANGATLAVNANFFGMMDPAPQPGEAKPHYRVGAPADIRGLSKSERGLVSPVRTIGSRGDPALLISTGRARVAYARESDLDGVVCAIAGIGPTDNGQEPGTLLVEGGLNTGATARVGPKLRHPRTAAGVSADGTTLILLAIDGRQPGHSVGLTLPELADLMIELGARDAIALDGGGSTSFYLKRGDGSVLTNRPSDGHWRPVANHLGVWCKWPEAATKP